MEGCELEEVEEDEVRERRIRVRSNRKRSSAIERNVLRVKSRRSGRFDYSGRVGKSSMSLSRRE
jgi:hypothetical protein